MTQRSHQRPGGADVEAPGHRPCSPSDGWSRRLAGVRIPGRGHRAGGRGPQDSARLRGAARARLTREESAVLVLGVTALCPCRAERPSGGRSGGNSSPSSTRPGLFILCIFNMLSRFPRSDGKNRALLTRSSLSIPAHLAASHEGIRRNHHPAAIPDAPRSRRENRVGRKLGFGGYPFGRCRRLAQRRALIPRWYRHQPALPATAPVDPRAIRSPRVRGRAFSAR